MKLAPGLERLLATLSALALALLPHLGHLPVWVSTGVAGAMAWRLAAEQRGWGLPPRWLRLALALLATLGVLAGYRTLNGLDAGTALLTVMAGLKLAETRAPRDHAVLVFIGYFLCLASLLYTQTFATLAFVLFAAWALTAALARSHRHQDANAPGRPFRIAARVLVLGLPLAAILFLFVPRIEGRFWALPSDPTRGTTGIDERMSPGDVSKLGLSDDPAFRVWFDGAAPAPEQRYWRMLVLEDFDGRTWTRARSYPLAARLEPAGEPIGYRVALEPTDRQWLVALDYVAAWPEELAVRTPSLQLVYVDPKVMDVRRVTSTLTYSARSYPAARLDLASLSTEVTRRDLRLPDGRAPRTVAYARALRAETPDPRALIERLLARFRAEAFEYSLEPPPLGAEPVDEFLFQTRSGFCEHYASAFAVLMRAAGVPARVVIGYQGGEYNAYGGYLLVRQSTAHAWNEVWLDGSGWVRVDPTAAVAPERVRRGTLDGSTVRGERAGGALRQLQWLGNLRAAFDAARTAWNARVVGFDSRAQAALLERLGLGERGWQGLAIALAVGFVLVALAIAAMLAWELRPPRRDPVLAAWDRVGARLALVGLARAAHEGPVDYMRRVAAAQPTLAADMHELVDAYVGLRFLPGATEAERRRFLALCARFVARR